jgi:class 3 adenylate cyclase
VFLAGRRPAREDAQVTSDEPLDHPGSPEAVPAAAELSLRVSDADRDTVIELLQERTADGTLTLDEFAARVEGALTARTRRDLDAATRDLPRAVTPTANRRSTTHTVVSVMAGAGKKGRWRCEERVVAVAVMGGCHIDFRGAEIDVDVVHVVAVAVMGGIDIVVPEGIEVGLGGLPIMGGKSMQVKDVPTLPGSPRILVHAYPIMGGVTVRSRPRKPGHRTAETDAQDPIEATAPEPQAPLLEGTVTLMFADVCDYSGLTDRLGDVAANEVLREYTRLVRSFIEKQGGHVVKSHGDGLMVAFPSVLRALRCAVDVQQALAKRNVNTIDEPLRAHLGIHAGEVVREGDDYLGRAVIVASRLADAAGPDEILVSSVARELAAGTREFTFESPRDVALKGVTEAGLAFPLAWQST